MVSGSKATIAPQPPSRGSVGVTQKKEKQKESYTPQPTMKKGTTGNRGEEGEGEGEEQYVTAIGVFRLFFIII